MLSEEQCYQIRIEGHVGLDWSNWFTQVTIVHTPGGQTVLTGVLADQSALHGVLMRIRDLGLFLVEVKRIEHPSEPKIKKE